MRDLWAAVVNQAMDDLRDFPYDSVEYSQAVEFFIGRGEWAKSREQIADYLEIHPDHLRRTGRAVIQARIAADGGPPPRQQVVLRAPAAPAPTPAPVLTIVQSTPHATRPDIARRLDPKRVQKGLKQPWWLQRKMA